MRAALFAMRALGLLSVAMAAMVCTAPVHAAEGGETEPKRCEAERELFTLVAEYAPLSPANGAVVQVGSAVTFSVETNVINPQVRFYVASSAASLSEPDIDSGAGSQQAGTSEYTFTSTKAAATARTVYWQASFTHVLESCGSSPVTVRTPERTLQVVGMGSGSGSGSGGGAGSGSGSSPSPAVPSASGSAPTISPSHLRVGITAARVIHLAHPVVAYVIDCTARCLGHTSLQAWLVTPHGKATRMRLLDFGPRSVSIMASAGGDERFSDRYRGPALRELRGLLRRGASVKLQAIVDVTDASGKLAQTRAVIYLRP